MEEEEDTQILYVLGDLLEERLDHWLHIIVTLLYHTRGIEVAMLNPDERPVNSVRNLIELSRSMDQPERDAWLITGVAHLPVFYWRAKNHVGRAWRPLEESLRALEHGGPLSFVQQTRPSPTPDVVEAWVRTRLSSCASKASPGWPRHDS